MPNSRTKTTIDPARAISIASVALLAALLGASCGKKGPPLPPEPRGPYPPQSVRARQVGRRVEIAFQVPQARGPRPAQQQVLAEVLRVDYPPDQQAPSDPDAFHRRGERVATLEAAPLPAETPLTLVDATVSRLPRQGSGATVRYGVRLMDRRGRHSPLVVAEDLVLLEPSAAPRDLRAEPTSDGVRLEWSEPPDEKGSLYNVYRSAAGSSPPERPLNPEPLSSTSFLDSLVEVGAGYRYVVRVVLKEGRPYREGESSPAVELVAEDRFAPARPEGLVAVQEGPAIRLFWNPSDERDLAGYRLYRRVGGDSWRRIGTDPIERPSYLDSDVSVGRRLTYRVTAVDRAMPVNESPGSETVELEVVAEPEAPVDR